MPGTVIFTKFDQSFKGSFLQNLLVDFRTPWNDIPVPINQITGEIIEHTVSILYFFVPCIQIIPNLHSFQLLVQVQYISIHSNTVQNSFRWHVMIAMRIYLTLFARGCRGGSAAGSRFDCHWAETSWSSCSSLFRFCKWEWVWIKNIQTHILKFGDIPLHPACIMGYHGQGALAWHPNH